MFGPVIAATASIVDIIAPNNATLQDAFQFDPAGTWLLAANFSMAIKMARSDPAALVTFGTSDGTIVVDDPVQRIIHMNITDTALAAALPVGEYVYDLVMHDASAPPIRTLLMQGRFFVTNGITET